jgi:transposase
MRKIRDVLRLHYETGLSKRRIAPRVGLGVTTVSDYLRRFRESGLSWPLPADMADSELERRLFPVTRSTPASERPLPDWGWVHRELRRKGVTLSLVWEEYRTAHPDGLGFTAFCNHYRAWEQRLPRTMRHRHRAGEKLFVDYAGYTVPVTDPATGETHDAQIFVAVLGASSLTYAEATWTQSLSDWLASHANTFAFLGGVPAEIVCDNLKSGVTTPDRYEPRANESYAQLAAHYATSIAAARVAKPRDKAKVEAGVQVVSRALARLRHRTFFSLGELNDAIRTEIDRINSKVMRHMGESRKTLFERLDKPELGALPRTPYQPTDVLFRTVGRDYHVNVDYHGYSVPHELVGAEVTVHVSRDTVEVYHDGKRVAVHPRSTVVGDHSTQDAHRPPGHRAYAGWTPASARQAAQAVGPATARMVDAVLADGRPDLALRTCAGILRLGREYGADRLEAACQRGLSIGAVSYTSLQSILARDLDRAPVQDRPPAPVNDNHANVRGAQYYQ